MKKPTKPKKRTQISKRAGIQDTPMRYYHALKERVEILEQQVQILVAYFTDDDSSWSSTKIDLRKLEAKKK